MPNILDWMLAVVTCMLSLVRKRSTKLGSLPDESVQHVADGNLEGARLLLGWQWLPPYGCMVVRSLSMTT